MDKDGFRPVTASSRYILADCEWLQVVMVGLGGLQMVLCEWFWVVVNSFGCLEMILGGFRWFSVIYSFSSYGEIC